MDRKTINDRDPSTLCNIAPTIYCSVEDKPQPKKDLLQKLLATESDEDDGAETASAAESEVEEEEVKQPTAVKKSLKSKFKKVLPMLRMGRKSTKTVEKQKPDPRLGLGTQVVQLKAGKTFGELALLRKDNKRAASVVTDADVSNMTAREPQSHIID